MAEPISADARPGAVRLTVADRDVAQGFYERSLGLRALESSDELVRLGTSDGGLLVELVGRPDAPPRPARTTGLFHLAILFPSRLDLARALHRVAGSGWRLTGASDHLVSEALYLTDPEGNGIELYRDRPRKEWSRSNGEVMMDTLPLDLESLIQELPAGDADSGPAPEGTRMGHVHLQVADLAESEAFYAGVLGFDVTVRGYPGALFVSAGGYHHHLGLNTWAGEDAPAPPPGSRGLDRYEIVVPSKAELDAVAGRLDAAAVETERDEQGVHAADPSGNRLVIRTEEQTEPS